MCYFFVFSEDCREMNLISLADLEKKNVLSFTPNTHKPHKLLSSKG